MVAPGFQQTHIPIYNPLKYTTFYILSNILLGSLHRIIQFPQPLLHMLLPSINSLSNQMVLICITTFFILICVPTLNYNVQNKSYHSCFGDHLVG